MLGFFFLCTPVWKMAAAIVIPPMDSYVIHNCGARGSREWVVSYESHLFVLGTLYGQVCFGVV